MRWNDNVFVIEQQIVIVPYFPFSIFFLVPFHDEKERGRRNNHFLTSSKDLFSLDPSSLIDPHSSSSFAIYLSPPIPSFVALSHRSLRGWLVIPSQDRVGCFRTSNIHRSFSLFIHPPSSILPDQLYICLRPFKWCDRNSRLEQEMEGGEREWNKQIQTSAICLWFTLSCKILLLWARVECIKQVYEICEGRGIFSSVLGAHTFWWSLLFLFLSFSLCRFHSPEKRERESNEQSLITESQSNAQWIAKQISPFVLDQLVEQCSM